jgi:hypothetical protein
VEDDKYMTVPFMALVALVVFSYLVGWWFHKLLNPLFVKAAEWIWDKVVLGAKWLWEKVVELWNKVFKKS